MAFTPRLKSFSRLAIVALALASVSLSGCLDDVGPRSPSTTVDGTARVRTGGASAAQAAEMVPLPAAIHQSDEVLVGVDVFNNVNGAPCSEAVSTCFEYRFTVSPENVSAGPLTLDLVLKWTVGSNDFDLYLFKGEDEVDRSADGAPETTEAIRPTLKAGSYRIVVAAWAAAQDTFTLDGTWSHATGARA